MVRVQVSTAIEKGVLVHFACAQVPILHILGQQAGFSPTCLSRLVTFVAEWQAFVKCASCSTLCDAINCTVDAHETAVFRVSNVFSFKCIISKRNKKSQRVLPFCSLQTFQISWYLPTENKRSSVGVLSPLWVNGQYLDLESWLFALLDYI